MNDGGKAAQIERIRRLQEEKLRYYHDSSDLCAPNPVQLRYHKSRAKIRGLFAGNQAGKTFAGTVDMLWTIGKVHPYRPNYSGLVYGRDCCDLLSTLRTTLIPTYRTLVPRFPCVLDGLTAEGRQRLWPGLRGSSWDKAWSDNDKTLYLADNSFVEFKSYEQEREAFQGPVRHKIRMDEEPPQNIYEENLARQATVGTNLDFSMTPLNYSAWLYSDIYERSAYDPDIECFSMSMYDNPYADPATVKKIEDSITDPVMRAARINGEFVVAEGRVYKEYGEHNYIVPFHIPRDWHRMLVIDAHQEKATYILWRATAPNGKRFYYREAQIKGSVDFICNEIKVRNGGDDIDTMLIDPSARQKSSIYDKGPLISYFKRHLPGLVEANNNALLGRDAVMKAVRNGPNGPDALIFQPGIEGFGCPILHHQMKNYSYKPPTQTGESRGKPEVVKKNDEGPDCLRYSEMYSFVRRGGTHKFTGFNMGVYAN